MSFEPLNLWFKEKARQLPWRLPRQDTEQAVPDPWAVLVSEIMLQQTQVATVLPYFKKWMARFPTYHDLAQAQEDEVMKLWEGLGYYRRAKGLQKAAQYLVQIQGFPKTREELLKIPGVGPYTSAALLAFAFHQKSVPVDGNVLRVASRWLGSDKDIAKASTAKYFEEVLTDHLPKADPWITSEALIELGATLCKPKNPSCQQCPLKSSCNAYAQNLQDKLPVKTKLQAVEKLWHTVAVIYHPQQEMQWLACQRTSSGLFQGLWHFPYIARETEAAELSYESLRLRHFLGLEVQLIQPLKKQKHTFTRFSAHLLPLYMRVHSRSGLATQEGWQYQWLDINSLKNLTFCSGHRQIRDELCQGQP
jgi:A/G-specific adenine glycosylase